jgi:hypothetical protein
MPVSEITARTLIVETGAKIDDMFQKMSARILRLGTTDMRTEVPIHRRNFDKLQTLDW